MTDRLGPPSLFAGLTTALASNLDTDLSSIRAAVNDSSLGFWNYSGTDSGSVNNYIFSCPFGVPSTLNIGMIFSFKPANTNTGSATLTVNSLSATVVRPDGAILSGGELPKNVGVSVQYDGASFRMLALPWVPVIGFYASSSTGPILDCTNASSVTVTITITASQTLVLINLVPGLPINIRVVNGTASSLLFKMSANSVSGAVYSNVAYKANVGGEISLSATGITTNANEVIYLNGSAIIGASSFVFFNAQL